MNEFLQRLRERKLVQWALAYVAAAFALIQVVDIVAQRFGWPEQTMRFVIIALAIGFSSLSCLRGITANAVRNALPERNC